jgi:AraC family transcriptional regulator of adaptative response / DNA-3-methyladenine glycosylase II
VNIYSRKPLVSGDPRREDAPMDLDPDACYRAISTRDARFDGRFFTAVKSTGIYCRPVCPARTPKRDNVVFFPSAAAAQSAGFRPCLRCRPETAPDIAAWKGTWNTISRALALIELGALDNADVDALATRLGVGERHLRRLFQQHLGASPIKVAQTRRVLLAKQLIHETTLPMTEIALAAGFGSIRRFNETFDELFGCSPSELRRELSTSASASDGIAVNLRYKPPYDWDSMLSFLKLRAVAGVEVVRDRTYARTIDMDGNHGIVTVAPGDGDCLRAVVRLQKISVLPQVIARLRRVFDLAADPHAIAAHLQQDPLLAELIESRPGLRVPGAWDGFELAMRAVLGQQITVVGAIRLAGKLVAQYGERLRCDRGAHSELTHVFPRPERLAAADLSTLGMPRARAKALSSLAAAVERDPEIFGARRTLEEAVEQLRSLPGIGEWTAQYIAMRALREPDAFPAADIGLLRAMENAKGDRPTPRELLARAEQWRPWRAYAAQLLWNKCGGAGWAGSAEPNAGRRNETSGSAQLGRIDRQ